MADTWKGLRRIAQTLQNGNSDNESLSSEYYRYVEVLEYEFLPLLEAAETATEICDEDDNCKACQLRTALKRLREGQP